MKQWGGRFEGRTDQLVEAFTASVEFDRRLYREDIRGSIAHCRMLGAQGIIPADEAQIIVAALDEIRRELDVGELTWRLELEDVHTHVESRLKEKVGEIAGKLHTGRSRNDQVATDLRLHVRAAIAGTVDRLLALQLAFLDLAARNDEAVIPGYTHLQRAQPVLLGHHLLAYFEMFQRDVERFLDAYKRADVLPLGSGALAGVPYPLDREAVAKELGFLHISRNSLDAVSDRDFAVEYLAAASLTMAHLSRFGEEVVLWSSAEFGFVEVDDAYATGSSIMPQKKNPDVAELVRGKTGRVYGDLIALLTILKGLPLSYNRDLQEDKEPLFDAVDTLQACLEVTAGLVRTLTFHADRTRQAAGESYTLATDLADYLAKRGLPFRQAHEVVGQIVRHCIAAGKQIQDLTLEEYRGFSPLFQADILQLSVDSALAARDVHGGTAPARVRFALSQARCVVDNTAKWAERSE